MIKMPPFASLETAPMEAVLTVVEVPADATPLDFLCAVYRDSGQPMPRRMRAAEAALKDAKPQSENGFKVELAKRCLVHALTTVSA